jgi:Putative glycosyltransferase (DUF6716)
MTPRGTARGFATVSSTAALEAMAMDRPTLINLVFEGSGCPGLDDPAAADCSNPIRIGLSQLLPSC